MGCGFYPTHTQLLTPLLKPLLQVKVLNMPINYLTYQVLLQPNQGITHHIPDMEYNISLTSLSINHY